MPNDAKLGLLAGVLGVIVVAAMSGKTPAALRIPGAAAPPPPPVVKSTTTEAKPATTVKTNGN